MNESFNLRMEIVSIPADDAHIIAAIRQRSGLMGDGHFNPTDAGWAGIVHDGNLFQMLTLRCFEILLEEIQLNTDEHYSTTASWGISPNAVKTTEQQCRFAG